MQKLGNVEDKEMFRTFNMGIGMAVVCSGSDKEQIVSHTRGLDEECFEGVHKIHGYPYKIYVDVDATKEIDNGKNQYRTASKKWEINDEPTI